MSTVKISHGQTEPDATPRTVPICYEKDWGFSAEIERLIVAKMDATSENANQGSVQCFSEFCQQPMLRFSVQRTYPTGSLVRALRRRGQPTLN